jgi:cytochrome c553
MQGYRPLVRAVLLASFLAAPFLSACGGDSAGPGDSLPACSLGSSMADIQEKLFRVVSKCGLCHNRGANGQLPLYPTNLDLGSPGLAERMVDKQAEADSSKGKCAGRILVPKNDPLGGVFVDKVSEKPVCGDRMPQALPRLSADEVSCVKRWAMLAAQSVP